MSNEVSPRILFVFEGVVATLEDQQKHDFWLKTHSYKRAMKMYEAVEHVQAVIWQITWRYRYSCDIVSYLPDAMRPHVQQWLDDRGYPFGSLLFTTVPLMARTIIPNPSVYLIYDTAPQRKIAYGHKSVHVEDPSKLVFG